MYHLTIDTVFCAAHSISIAGAAEPLHGHNWHVTATVESETLDADGLVCDFHTVKEVLDDILAPYHNRTLNGIPPFDRLNPTAEHIAREIARELVERLGGPLAPAARIAGVRVTESPGCAAAYTVARGEKPGSP
ncbi:MAG: 6-carboxytetrahydropterin synthase [Phycisphaeraceae bacterium]|nr:6-carboxytetrahydropterin synthase [Phycisphaeraceae bacterium]